MPRLNLLPRPRASRSAWLLLVIGFLLSSPAAQAQIVEQKPAKIKAANRRALREDRRTESPYKDSHLDVTADRLKRGQSTQRQPKTPEELNYKTGTAPNVKAPGLLGARRKKKR